MTLQPARMAPNTVEHFYLGGARIADLRGFAQVSDHSPEEWLAATVSRAGDPDVGPARTTEGDLFADLVAADRAGWVGPGLGPDTGVLVKLLDAGQRLPVHVHPDRAFAASHLGCDHGKTEAWFVLAADAGARVHLGWTEDVEPDELARRRDAQDSAWMLERLHAVPVAAGDAILVPAGQPHAIGAGVFVVEAQEPTDLSIVLEWSVTTSTREDSHLGLGFDVAMGAVSHARMDERRLADLCRHLPADVRGNAPLRCLPEEADAFFRLDLLAPGGADEVPMPAGYAVVAVVEGSGGLEADGCAIGLARGDVVAVPHALGEWRASGDLRALVVRPGTTAGGAA